MTLVAPQLEKESLILSDPIAKQWTRDEYQRLGDSNFFDEQRVELIEGEIVVVAPQKDVHSILIGLVRRAVAKVFDDSCWIREQGPLGFGSASEPEPDVSVVSGMPREFLGRGHPSNALLVVEISQSTLRFDRTRKANLYAKNNIADYWIVNLIDMQVEVHRQPEAASGTYKEIRTYKRGESIAPLAAVSSPISVNDVLP